MLNALLIIGLVLLPLAASIFIVTAALQKSISPSAIKRTVSLHSSEGLANQGLFWLSILVPTLLFFEFGYFVWSGMELALTLKGFQNFVSMSALPIGLLSLSIPAAALVTKLHSTAQTAKQIVIAEKKNNYDLFYMHRREFVGFYEQIGPLTFLDEFTTAYKINPRLHARVFSGSAAAGIPMLREKFINERIAEIKLARELLINVLTSDDLAKALPSYIRFSSIVESLLVNFGARDVLLQMSKQSVHFTYLVRGEGRTQRTAGSTVKHAIAAFRCAKSYAVLAMEFAGYEEGVQAVRDDEVDFVDQTTGYQTINNQEVRVVEALINNWGMQKTLKEYPDLTQYM